MLVNATGSALYLSEIVSSSCEPPHTPVPAAIPALLRVELHATCPHKAGSDQEVRMTDFFAAIADTIGRDGFAFVRAPEMHAALEGAGLRGWVSVAGTCA